MSYLQTLLGDAYKEGMTEDEISAALEESIKPSKGASGDDNKELAKLKKLLENANSEAAKYKKELRAKQDAAEAEAAERKEYLEKLEARNAELEKNEKVSSLSIQLLAQGYDAELAKNTAVAIIDGDLSTFVANNNTFLEGQKKAMEAELLHGTPRPGAGASNGVEDYSKLIENARQENDPVAAAYYTRLQAQAQATPNNN